MILVFEVVASQVKIRTEPHLRSQHLIVDKVLMRGQTVRVDGQSRTVNDGYVWWKHDDGWSASGTVSNSREYMRWVADEEPALPIGEISGAAPTSPSIDTGNRNSEDEPVGTKSPDVDGSETGHNPQPASEQLQFHVVYSAVRTRTEPRVHYSNVVAGKALKYGQIVTVKPNSRTIRDGYVWWQHNDGWSAEISTDRRLVFMEKHQPINFDDDPTNGVFLKVPWETQVGNWSGNDCGPACVLMLLKYRGLGEDDTVDSLARIEPGLTSETELESLARKKDLTLKPISVQRDDRLLADLRKNLLDDTPVILLVYYPALRFRNPTGVGARGHWLVVVGFDDDRFFVHDPLFGRDQRNHYGGTGGAYLPIAADRLASASRYLALLNPPQPSADKER